MNNSKRLLYYCPVSIGGIARNTHEQAKAFFDQGIDITVLCPKNWHYSSANKGYKQLKVLASHPNVKQRGNWKSKLLLGINILQNIKHLTIIIDQQKYSHVLLASYSEYLSPLWSWLLKKYHHQGIVFGVMVLDPVRDYVVGPLWWHQWSIAEAYSFVREAFVHKKICLDTIKPMPYLRTTVVPHGSYLFPPPTKTREEVRAGLEISEKVHLFLSFGHLRDNKNLDLLIQALVDHPDSYLLVAGAEASPNQKTSQDYQAIAKFHGVFDRVRWLIDYIPDEEVANLFNAVDYAVMCYSKTFRSTSGILYIAAPLKIPILVSCGDAPLGTLVEQYQLGHRIVPDSVKSISDGIDFLVNNFQGGQWEAFLREQTYQENTRIIIEKLGIMNEIPDNNLRTASRLD